MVRTSIGPPTRSAIFMMIGTLAICGLCLLALGIWRAGWLDEYWTVWESDPSVPFRQAYWTRWIWDSPHPPTYYALSWLLAPLTGPTLVARRLVVNSLAFVPILITVLVCRRGGRNGAQPWLFALLIASNPFFLTYYAEHRSYFFAIATASAAIATVRQLHRDTALGEPPRPALVIWLALVSLIALNLHYMVSMCLLTVLGFECLWQWFWGGKGRAVLIAVIAIVTVAPAMTALWFGMHAQKLMPVTHDPYLRAWATIGFMAILGAIINLALLVHAAPEVKAMVTSKEARDDTDGSASFIAIILLSLAVLVAVFVVVHAVNHNMYPRLVIGMIPLASAGLAELAARRPLSETWLRLACANALLIVAGTAAHGLTNGRWEYYAPDIARTVKACPSTRVLAYHPLYLLPRDAPGWKARGQPEAMAFAYHMIGRKYGFTVHVLPMEGPPPPAPADCPTLLWLEHNFFRPDIGMKELAEVSGLGAPTPRMSLKRVDWHYLLRVEPDPARK